jgi:AcrR family transcriptional regulator
MTTPDSTRDDNRSRQKRVGDALRQDTRNRLLDAAESEFAAKGYAATTVAGLAAAAGVSLQTLYLAWGSKRALLRGYMEKVLAGEAESPDDAAERFSGDLEPSARLHLLATLVTDVARRAATGWSLYRDAAAVDPEIAEDWTDLQRRRHQLFTRIVGGIPAEQLSVGTTPEQAIDTAWTIASPETYDLLVNRLGYGLDEYREWLERTLRSALLAGDR